MLKYILKRVLFSIPTLLAISLLTFFISVNAPGDPVEMMLNKSDESGGQRSQNYAGEKDYQEMRHLLGLDQPLFYFSLTDATVPDTLYRIAKPKHRAFLKRLSAEYGNWENVSAYYLALKNIELLSYSERNSGQRAAALELTNTLLQEYKEEKIKQSLSQFPAKSDTTGYDTITVSDPKKNYDHFIAALRASFDRLSSEKSVYTKYIPVIHWYGTHNQYHRWMMNFLTGDFGVSYQDKRPVKTVLYGALKKTLQISLLSLLIAYLIAIPLGVHSAVKKGTLTEKSITTSLFVLYSLPNFWIATMLVVFLCGGDYLSWFPAPGSPPIPEEAPLWYKFSEGGYRLILPLFCWAYGSIAFISRQMRGGILSSITQDYIRTARAKGLNEKQIAWKHAMKNSLLPVITLFASIFPLAISGAFIIETIFNIPGMGKLSLEALYSRDYPVIFTVMMFTTVLTIAGNLIADLLYALIDPRISYAE